MLSDYLHRFPDFPPACISFGLEIVPFLPVDSDFKGMFSFPFLGLRFFFFFFCCEFRLYRTALRPLSPSLAVRIPCAKQPLCHQNLITFDNVELLFSFFLTLIQVNSGPATEAPDQHFSSCVFYTSLQVFFDFQALRTIRRALLLDFFLFPLKSRRTVLLSKSAAIKTPLLPL